ncbi:MAG: hypothetical protein JSU80_03160, partial [Deltaproteobacteria bacterium]
MKVLVKAVLYSAILFIAICSAASGAESKPEQIDCDVHAGPCSADLFGTKVSLNINPKPVRAMQDLVFTVTFVGEKVVADPYIDLGMVGMNMGKNRVLLRPAGELVYRGAGFIVRCPSGR